MAGAEVAAKAGGTRLTPDTAAAARRSAPTARAATSASSAGSIATRRTPVSAAGPPRPPGAAATWTNRPAPVHTGSVKARAAPASSATSSGVSIQGPQAAPSRLVRRRTVTAPSPGTSQTTPAMEKRMPASMLRGAAPRAAGPASTSLPSPGILIVFMRTEGVRIHSAAVALARGTSQTTTRQATIARTVVASAPSRRGCRAVERRVMWPPSLPVASVVPLLLRRRRTRNPNVDDRSRCLLQRSRPAPSIA